jgi:ankyrin repeat protein
MTESSLPRLFQAKPTKQLAQRLGADAAEIKALLAAGADPNYRDGPHDSTTFLNHLPRLSLEALRAFLDAGAEATTRAPRDQTSALHALITPIEEDYAPRVAALIAAGTDVDAVDRDGLTVLYHASSWARPDVVQLLLEHGADPNVADKWGRVPLHTAARRPEVLRVLLAHGADPGCVATDGTTALHVAVDRRQADSASALVAAGCPLNARTSAGETALYRAVKIRDIGLVRLLVNAGAALDVTDVGGRSAVDLAVELLDEDLLTALGCGNEGAARASRAQRANAALAQQAMLLDRLATGHEFFRVVTPGYKYEADDDHDVFCRAGVWQARYWDDFHGVEHLRDIDREAAWEVMSGLVQRPEDGPEVIAAKIEAALRPVTAGH